MAEEQAALRRVATMVAQQPSPDEVFMAVTEEVGRLLSADLSAMHVYPGDGTARTIAGWSETGAIVPIGTELPLDGESVVATVFGTWAPARMDSYDDAEGDTAQVARDLGLRSTIGAPIVIDGYLWGALVAATRGAEHFPPGAEARIAAFTELVATAVSNTEARRENERLASDLRGLADEQAALRRVATLVADGAPTAELFDAVCVEAGKLIGATGVNLARYLPHEFGEAVAGWSINGTHIPIGTRLQLEPDTLSGMIRRAGRPMRKDSYDDPASELAQLVRHVGIRSTVGTPVIVDGEAWGALLAGVDHDQPLAPGTEERLARFSELIATAISNAEARDGVGRLAAEQAGLRRVATLVAQRAPATDLYAAVAEEVAQVLDVMTVNLVRYEPGRTMTVVASLNNSHFPVGSTWPLEGESVSSRVLDSGAPMRIDDYSELPGPISEVTRSSPISSSVGVPIVVGGAVWGTLVVSGSEPLPDGIESRLGDFTELVATAIANAESRAELAASEARAQVLASEQAALRRVATLVAGGVAPLELFSAVCREAAHVFGGVGGSLVATVIRFDPGPRCTLVGASRAYQGEEVGSTWKPKELYVSTRVLRSGHSARVDEAELKPVGDPDVDVLRLRGFVCQVGTPVVVEDRLWGAMTLNASEELAPDTAARLERFTDLVATAISNTDARDSLARLADVQAALRRVATLVAEDAAPAELFAAVADEVALVLDVSSSSVSRFLPDGVSVVLASLNDPGFPVGSRWQPDAGTLNATILETGRPVRIDQSGMSGPIAAASRVSDVQSVVGVPIVVEGNVWGLIAVGRQHSDEPLPADTEARLTEFMELIATAISNTESRDAVARLADEQAALRHVATLVAREASSTEIFEAVTQEAALVLGIEATGMLRFEPDGVATLVAQSDTPWEPPPLGTRLAVEGENVVTAVLRTRRPARDDDWTHATGPISALAESLGVRSCVATPIVVEGRLWGAMIAATSQLEPLPADTELRLGQFTDLVATAVSNAATRAELMASRARLVAAGDEARRKIERNLHDGTQQRLVTIDIGLRALESRIPAESTEALESARRIRDELRAALEEVREVSRGLHPSTLAEAGLESSLRSLARRAGIGVDFRIELLERPPEPIEIGIYYLVSEALTNIVKHARAGSVSIEIATTASALRVTVEDDGAGGARITRGSGLEGLVDRVEALGGRLELDSPPGRGTRLVAVFPLADLFEETETAESEPLVSIQEHLSAVAEAARVLETVGRDGALYVVDRFGRIDFMDEQGHRILGYEDGELSGKPAHDTIHYLRRDGSAFPAADCPLLEPWLTGEAVTVDEDWFVAKDGSFVPVAYTAAPLSLPGARATVIGFRVRPDAV